METSAKSKVKYNLSSQCHENFTDKKIQTLEIRQKEDKFRGT